MGFVEENGHYYDRCGDCGGTIKERKQSKRASICDDCWERRGWVVEHMSRIVEYFGIKEFGKLQSSMAHHTGTAKRKILSMVRELPAPIEEKK